MELGRIYEILDLSALPFDEVFDAPHDDKLTHVSDDSSLKDILSVQVTDLHNDEDHETLSDVDWEKVDWEHVAANWNTDELVPLSTNNSLLEDENAQKNKRRRMKEMERLEKYSWYRFPLHGPGKRARTGENG